MKQIKVILRTACGCERSEVVDTTQTDWFAIVEKSISLPAKPIVFSPTVSSDESFRSFAIDCGGDDFIYYLEVGGGS